MIQQVFSYFLSAIFILYNTGFSEFEKKTGASSDKPSFYTNSFLADANLNGRYDSIPQWYLQNRIQVVSSLMPRDFDQPYFFDFPQKLAEAGTTVLTREIKSGDEQPWWPSKYGTELPAAKRFDQNGKNLATDIIDQIHKLNMKAIIYYRHTEDSEMLATHPDWACTDVDGTALKTTRGIALSLNSPYRNVIIQRVKELTLYGADGFYFDYIQIPLGGDFSTYSQKLYKQQYGTDLIADYKAGKLLQFYNFRNQTINNFFTDLKEALKDIGKNPVLLVSGNSWPTLSDLHMSSDFYKNFTLKSELEVPNRPLKNRTFTMPPNLKQEIPSFYVNAFSFSFMRDNSYGPPNIWCPQIASQKDAESITAGLISLGCIAEVDINHKRSKIDNFTSILPWNKKYGDYFAKMVPYSVAGITVSENQRNKFLRSPAEAWKQVLIPSYTAFEKLYQSGIPVRLLSDAQLTKGNLKELNVVYTNKSLQLSGPDNTFSDFSDLNNLSGLSLAQKTGTPVFCKKDNEFTHVNYFSDKEGYIYIVCAPDFNSVKKNFNKNAKTNLKYTENADYQKSGGLHVYIKTGNNATGSLQDITNNKTINSSSNEGGYAVFNINPVSLGMYRFKLKQ